MRKVSIVLRYLLSSLATVLAIQIAATAPTDVKYPVDLKISTFNTTLQALEAPYALIEFYASWCPACRHFAPQYEKIGKYFASHKPHAGELYVARVDCATETDLCVKFKVESYPNVRFGPVDAFTSVNQSAMQSYPARGSKDAVTIVKWVGTHLKEPLEYKEEGAQSEVVDTEQQKDGASVSSSMLWTLSDTEGATQMQYEIIMAQPVLHTGVAKRSALLTLINLWGLVHPSMRCRSACEKLASSFDVLWPKHQSEAPKVVREYKVCGPNAGPPNWVACRGTLPRSRGFSCALWLLFHSMAHRLPQAHGGVMMMEFLQAFNQHFFQCETCQRHFSKMLEQPQARAVVSRSDAILWLWKAHNEVNSRLAVIEDTYGHSTTGDPSFPKLQWPTPHQCPLCHKGPQLGDEQYRKLNHSSVQWDEAQVLVFLDRVYERPIDAASPQSLRYSDIEEEGVMQARETSVLTSRRTHYLLALLLVTGVGAYCWLVFWRGQQTQSAPKRRAVPSHW